jgi:hydrogenase maturation protease
VTDRTTALRGAAAVADGAGDALLIGYGNPLRGDDGVGWHVADAVLDAAPATARIRVITALQLTPELAEDVAAARTVVFVDAACDAEPGTVRVREIHPAAGPPAGFTQHQFDPASLLWLAEHVFGRSPASAVLITVGAADFPCEQRLSPAVSAAVLPACRAALQQLCAAPRDMHHAAPGSACP